jgi:hypothetical protein
MKGNFIHHSSNLNNNLFTLAIEPYRSDTDGIYFKSKFDSYPRLDGSDGMAAAANTNKLISVKFS